MIRIPSFALVTAAALSFACGDGSPRSKLAKKLLAARAAGLTADQKSGLYGGCAGDVARLCPSIKANDKNFFRKAAGCLARHDDDVSDACAEAFEDLCGDDGDDCDFAHAVEGPGFGRDCRPGQNEYQGKCFEPCGRGLVFYQGSCLNLKSDPNNCGQIGNVCDVPDGDPCVDGECEDSCPDEGPATDCAGSCTDLGSDAQNCGACGARCGPGQSCEQGKCLGAACVPGTCGAQGKNCGSISDGCGGTLDCGSCPAGQTCGGGGTANVCGAAAPPFTPSHVAPGDLTLGTADLTVRSSIRTDSGTLLIDGAPAPAGAHFAVENNLAVLAVRSFTVPAGATVRVTGALPLVVVAGGDITIAGSLDAGARGTAPGAGGFAPGSGPGAGAPGTKGPPTGDTGGAGAGFGGSGGASGAVVCAGPVPGANAGLPYGTPTLPTLTGGSGGGAGSGGVCGAASGGGGGGAIQLSAGGKLTVAGGVNAGGGGGRGGCASVTDAGAGGGGGSGGALFLESPSVTISGVLSANGAGGGGGGASSIAGDPGSDGPPALTAASGGAGGQVKSGNPVATDNGGSGGSAGPGLNSAPAATCGNTGGGGGGTGRIFLRSRGSLAITGPVSPAPAIGVIP